MYSKLKEKWMKLVDQKFIVKHGLDRWQRNLTSRVFSFINLLTLLVVYCTHSTTELQDEFVFVLKIKFLTDGVSYINPMLIHHKGTQLNICN